MATVTFDAVGPGAAGVTATSTSPATWTHVNGGNGIIIALDNATGSANNYTTVTYGGVTVPFLGYATSNTGTLGGVSLYGLLGPTCPTGSNTVSVAWTGGAQTLGGSVSVANAATFGTVFTASSTGAAPGVGVTNCVGGGLVVAGFAFGSATGLAATNGGTIRWSNPHDTASGAGCGAQTTVPSVAGATTTASCSITADWYGVVAVEVRPLGGGQQERVPQQMSRVSMRARKRTQRPQYNVQSPDVNILATTLSAQVSLPAAFLPPTHPYITGLSGSTSADYFTDQTGAPRWMFCDSIWTIVYSAGRSGAQTWQQDMDQVISARGASGYTAIQCNLLPNNEYVASGLTTFDGVHPFITGVDPSSGLNSTYWARVDYLLASAANNGITIFMNLLMGEDIASGVAAAWTGVQKTAYGTAVATRYLSTPNIIWMIGDDGGVDDTTLGNILSGVRAAGDTRPVANENVTETTSRRGIKLNDAMTWGLANAQYQWVYSYNVAYLGIEYAFSEASPIPVLRGDGDYVAALGNGLDDLVMRNHLWWSVSSGSRGFSGGILDGGWNAFNTTWQTSLTIADGESGTSGDYQNNVFPAVTTFLKALPNWWKLMPDTGNAFITAGRGTKATAFTENLGSGTSYTGSTPDTYISGSVAPDGSLAMIYFSPGSSGTITVNQSLMAPGYTAMWVDPCTCATTSIAAAGTYLKKATANSAGDHDWVLILQAPVAAAPATSPAPQVAPGWFPGAPGNPAMVPFYVQPQAGPPAGAITQPGTGAAAGAGAVTALAAEQAIATSAGAAAVTDVATVTAPATAAAVGAVTALAVQQAPGTAAAAASVTDVVTEQATGSASAAGAVTDVVTEQATGAAIAAGSVTALTATLAGGTAAGAASVADVVTQIATAAAAGAGSVTAAGTSSGGGTAAAAGAGSVTAVVTEQPIAASAGAATASALATQIAIATAAGAGSVTDVVTQQATGTAAGSGSVADVVTQQVTGAAAGAALVADVVTEQAIAAAAGTGSVTDVVTQIATAPAAGAAVTSALAIQAAIAAAAGAGSVTAVVTQIAFAAAAGAGSVTAVGSSSGAATGTAAGAGSVTDVVTQITPATGAGQGAAAATATEQAPAASAGASSASAVVTEQPIAAAAGAGAATAAGAVLGQSTGAAAGTAAVTAVATVQAPATAAGAGAVAALAVQQSPGASAGAGAVNASGYIAGLASVTAAGAVTTAKSGQAVIATATGAGSLSALAAQQAITTLSAAGAVNAIGQSQAAVIKGSSTGTTVTEQAGMSAAVTEPMQSAPGAVTNPASSQAGVS